MTIRPAYLAGSWYPATASACEGQIRQFLMDGSKLEGKAGHLAGGIVPHAGWYFSGSIACNVIHMLSSDAQADVVVIFGKHLPPGAKPCIQVEGAWETPLGPIEIDAEFAKALAERLSIQTGSGDPFAGDNTVEIQLPFIKYCFKGARFVPVGVPPAVSALDIGQAAAALAKEKQRFLKVLGSTDLTHYGYNYGFMPEGTGSTAYRWVKNENDASIIRLMEAMAPEKVVREALENSNACCAGAAAAALAAGRQMGAQEAVQVAYGSSYDKHPGDSFVGYVGMVF